MAFILNKSIGSQMKNRNSAWKYIKPCRM